MTQLTTKNATHVEQQAKRLPSTGSPPPAREVRERKRPRHSLAGNQPR